MLKNSDLNNRVGPCPCGRRGRAGRKPADFRERAFVATYQDLGYLEGDRFTVLSPVDRAEQFLLRPTDDDPYALERTEAIDSTHLNRAISLYQTSSQWNKR